LTDFRDCRKKRLGQLFTGGGMKILAARIKRQLLLDTGKWGHCAIYENELQRIWPLNEENRKRKIEQFAKEHGLLLSFYKLGLCAIFETERHRSQFRGRRGVSRVLRGQTIAQRRKMKVGIVNEKLLMLLRRFVLCVRNVAAKSEKAVKEELVMLSRRFVLFARDVGRNRATENQDKVVPRHFAWPHVMNSFGTMHGPIAWRTWIWNRQRARWHHGYYKTHR